MWSDFFGLAFRFGCGLGCGLGSVLALTYLGVEVMSRIHGRYVRQTSTPRRLDDVTTTLEMPRIVDRPRQPDAPTQLMEPVSGRLPDLPEGHMEQRERES